MSTNRVLIAGAGPVGCVAALTLARAGIPVTLFEKAPELPPDLRASTFHPPTLDMLDRLGVAEPLIARGLICPAWQHRDRKLGVIAEWDLGLLADDTDHPYRVQCEQYQLTGIIAAELAGIDLVEFRLSSPVTGVRQDADSVTVTVEGAEGVEEISGSYLIAADGAASTLRTAIDVGFDGLTFPELWLVASTDYDFSLHFDNLTPIAYVSDPDEWFVFIRVPGLWRVLIPAREGETAESIVAEENLQRRMHSVWPRQDSYRIAHSTAYPVHQRVAATYRRGRVLLAGDAAHLNNPLGGMGMNGGIHDAVNLCQKLIPVWRGEASDDGLDLYGAQRRSVALEDVQAATLRNKALLEETDPKIRRQRQDELSRTAADPARAREFLLRSSMISGLRKVS